MRNAGRRFRLAVCLVAIAARQAKPTNYKGLEITPLGIERAKNVALHRLPAGQQHACAATRAARKSSPSSRSRSR